MHLVFLNQYYPPDAAPTGVMLQAVAEECARQGHQVTVICAAGGYADGVKLKSEIGKAEIRDENPESRIQMERGIHSASSSVSQLSTLNPQPSTSLPPTLHRLPATRFGRGTFVGKLLDYASYYLGVAWRLGTMNPPPDRIVALTTPPYLSVLARVVSKPRGADHAHWVMDLYPDVMVAHGMLAEGGWKHRWLAGLARWGFGGRRCAAVLTLGPDMAERCEELIRTQSQESRVQTERGIHSASTRDCSIQNQKSEINNHQSSIPPISWVPLWGAEDNSSENQNSKFNNHQPSISPSSIQHSKSNIQNPSSALLRLHRGWADDELIVMYSGNMGLGHRFGEILEVAGKGEEELSVVSCQLSEMRLPGAGARPPTNHRPPTTLQKQRFVFYGGGKRRGEIEAFMKAHPGAPVELHDYAPAEELSAHLMTADVHLVSLEPAWTGTMVPSKLQGIFAAGRPVVFVGAAESSIGRWVAESGGGWVVAPGDVAGLRAALEEAREPEVRQARGAAAAGFAKQHFDRKTNVRRVVEVLVG